MGYRETLQSRTDYTSKTTHRLEHAKKRVLAFFYALSRASPLRSSVIFLELIRALWGVCGGWIIQPTFKPSNHGNSKIQTR
jgi:hypothetical protein